MTAISEVISQTGLATVASKPDGDMLGKDAFLKLLVAQLQHQDPLSPADPTEFTAQLSQFSSLEQLFTVNEQLSRMNNNDAELASLSALSLLGREAVAAVGSFSLAEENIELGYQLEGPVDEVSLLIQDQQGRTVATLAASEVGAGEHFLVWDGTGQNGRKLPAGEYNFLVSALRLGKDGKEAVPATSLIKGVVSGVDLAGKESVIVTAAGEFRLADVKSVRSLEH